MYLYGANELLARFPGVKIYTNAEGEKTLYDTKLYFSKYYSEIQPFVYAEQGNVELLEDDMVLELFSGEPLRVIFTPGHDASCISYVIGKNVFTGDSYLPGIKTVMNFHRSNRALALKNTAMLKELEQQGYIILCGHYSYL